LEFYFSYCIYFLCKLALYRSPFHNFTAHSHGLISEDTVLWLRLLHLLRIFRFISVNNSLWSNNSSLITLHMTHLPVSKLKIPPISRPFLLINTLLTHWFSQNYVGKLNDAYSLLKKTIIFSFLN
jgi:hypothetical protein